MLYTKMNLKAKNAVETKTKTAETVVRITHEKNKVWKENLLHSWKGARCSGLIVFKIKIWRKIVHHKLSVFLIRFVTFTSNHADVV